MIKFLLALSSVLLFAAVTVAATPTMRLDYYHTGNEKEERYSVDRIVLEAVDIGKGHTFLHLTYSYGFGTAGRIAMKTYLATIGSAKVGFTKASGDYVGGVRGLVERNTMRYYLAIDAYLASLSAPANQRLDDRLNRWFDATEQYPRQLHEVEKVDYLEMKHDEYQRQQTAQ